MRLKRVARTAVVLLAGFVSAARAGSPPTVYVNNLVGSDKFDGGQETVSGDAGPVATLARGTSLLKPSGRLVIQNTGKPYRGEVRLIDLGGTADQPLIIDGNGAVIEGIGLTKPGDWKDEGNGIISTEWRPDWGFFVVFNGEPRWASALDNIQPAESYGDYTAHRGYFRLPQDADLNATPLEIPAIWSGVTIYDSQNIVIRNLHTRFYLNDGFNFGGKSENIRFENVEASYNGDEGISAHNQASAYVTNSSFHHNDNGICDTGFSRTGFNQVSVHDNRTMGVWFIGGEHSLVDVRIWSNPTGILLQPAAPPAMPGSLRHPYINCRTTLRNVWVEGGAYGIKVLNDCSASVEHSTFVDQPVGIVLDGARSHLHLMNSIIRPQDESLHCDGDYFGDYNCWGSTRGTFQRRAELLADWFKQQGLEAHSIHDDPRLDPENTSRLLPGSPAIGRAYLDLDYQAYLRASSYVSPTHGPTQSQNMGAQFTDEKAIIP
jgi:Right handed beta helix region